MKWFKLSEFNCKCGCGRNNVKEELLLMLDEAREEAGVVFRVNSGCRCRKYNEKVGGTTYSSHLKGLAADIRATSNKARFRIITGLLLAGFSRIGIGKRFIHADVDGKKPQTIMYLY